MWSAIVSGLSAALQWGLALFKAKNSPTMQAAADAKTQQKVDENSTQQVEKAIETGNLDDLRK